jgi:hypothetical protein
MGRYGVPVNHEDKLATLMGLSLLVVDGLDALGAGFEPDDAEAYYYVWRTFGQLMGIHPPGRPDDASYLPPTLADARAFYTLYSERNYVGPTTFAPGSPAEAERANRAGYLLGQSHIRMLTHIVPLGRQLPFLSVFPRFYIRHLCGDAPPARVGIAPAPMHGLLRALLIGLPALWARLWNRVDPGVHRAISRWFLRGMIRRVYGNNLEYFSPYVREDLLMLVDPTLVARAAGRG